MSVQQNCRFFLNGNCRYGDRCRFRHPGFDYEDFTEDSNYGDYYVSSNHRTLIRSSSPPAGSRSPPSTGVSFSFNKAHAETSQSYQKPNLFSVNRFASLSDDEEMEDTYRGGHSPPTSPRHDSTGSNSSQYKWTKPNAASDGKNYGSPPSSGLFGKPATNQPVTFSFTQQARNVAPEHAGLFKPKAATQILPTQNFSFAPNQVGQTTNQSQGLFGRSSFATTNQNKPFGNAPSSNQGLFGRSSFATPKTMFGHPVQPAEVAINVVRTPITFQQPATMFGKPVESGGSDVPMRSNHQASSFPKSVLSDSAFLDGLGNNPYSLMEELNQAERDSFMANVFDLSIVPVKPPPKELCF